MFRLTLLAALPLFVSCADGGGGTEFVPPEDCTNGVDDNGNGLVDCDDSAFCGGPQCLQGPDTGGTGGGNEPLEINYTDGQCNFLFSANDCQKLVCTIAVANNTDEDGTLTANCENPVKDNYDTVIQFRNVQDNTGRLNALSASPIDKESSTTIEMFYNCFTPDTFTTSCTIQMDADDRQEDVDFTIEAISTD